ncbi:hypothetical protein Sjap_003795 [Stephania japonica]|uniref:Uncharacterized protein n=1 Tax=Stephania japonica TaxID=461633 RepID=A0AAP0KS43_9MAGN
MEHHEPQTPHGETTRVLVEFLEVAVNSIVFLYPSGAFERQRYMNIVVHKARHPQLKEYIHAFERQRYMNIVVHKARHPQLKEYIHSRLICKLLNPSSKKVCNGSLFCK